MRLLAWVALANGVAAAAVCSTAQQNAFDAANTTVPARCRAVLRDFATCGDDCLASFHSVVEQSPACSPISETVNGTVLQAATQAVDQCQLARANVSDKYVPTLAPHSAPACTSSHENEWNAQFGPEYIFGACSADTLNNGVCTTDCLSKIEEGVQAAPLCRIANGDYMFGEAMKFHLVRCLHARGEPVDSNAVLRKVDSVGSASASGDGASVAPATNATPPTLSIADPSTSPAPSSSSATAPKTPSVAVGIGLFVLSAVGALRL